MEGQKYLKAMPSVIYGARGSGGPRRSLQTKALPLCSPSHRMAKNDSGQGFQNDLSRQRLPRLSEPDTTPGYDVHLGLGGFDGGLADVLPGLGEIFVPGDIASEAITVRVFPADR